MNDRKNMIKRTPCILVVEDDQLAMEFLREQLKSLGYKVLTASNGSDAMNALKRDWRSIDGLIVDREMPKGNGIELIKTVRRNEVLSFMPILMISGHDTIDSMTEAILAGATGYLAKPIFEDILQEKLAEIMDDPQEQT